MAKKEVKGLVKLVVPAKQANPAPPIGPALGAAGVNIAEFCKQFNDKTSDKEPGMPIPCIITVYTDRSFEFVMKLPPVSYYIKKALKARLVRINLVVISLEHCPRIKSKKLQLQKCQT